MLYGHVHNHTKESYYMVDLANKLRDSCFEHGDNRGQLINVGCMAHYMDYTPRTLGYLIDKFDKGETRYI
jgi:hypothetical protein